MAQSEVFEFKGGQLDAVQVSDGALWHKYNQGAGWKNEAIPLPAGFGPVTGEPRVSIVGGACYITVEDANAKMAVFVQAANAATWGNSILS